MYFSTLLVFTQNKNKASNSLQQFRCLLVFFGLYCFSGPTPHHRDRARITEEPKKQSAHAKVVCTKKELGGASAMTEPARSSTLISSLPRMAVRSGQFEDFFFFLNASRPNNCDATKPRFRRGHRKCFLRATVVNTSHH